MTQTLKQDYYYTYSALLDNFKLSSAAYKLACLLIKSHNKIKGYSFKSKRTMANECECSISTISRAIRELLQNKVITKEAQLDEKNFGRQTTNYYFVNFKLLKKEKSPAYKVAGGSEKLSGSSLIIYNYIAKKVGIRGNWSLSYNDISKACKVSKSTVHHALKLLKKQNLICVVAKKHKNCYDKNIFSLVFNSKKRKKVSKMTVTERCAKLSPNAKKIYTSISNNNVSFRGTYENLSTFVNLNKEQLKKAIDELMHYQLLSIFTFEQHPDINSIREFILEDDDNERMDDVPVLPDDTKNAEPFILPVEKTFIALSDITPDEYKALYFIWNYRTHEHRQPTAKEIGIGCNYVEKKVKATLKMLITKKLIRKDSNNTYYITNKELYARVIKDYSVFKLSSKIFKVYSFMFYLADDKTSLYIEKVTLAHYCGVTKSSITNYISKLREKNLLTSKPFCTQFGGRLGNIQKLMKRY